MSSGPYGTEPGTLAYDIASAISDFAAGLATALDPPALADLRFQTATGPVTLEELLDQAITLPTFSTITEGADYSAPDLSGYVDDLGVSIAGVSVNFAAPVQDLLQALEDGFSDIVNGVKGVVVDIVNGLIPLFNTYISGPNGLFESLTDLLIGLGVSFADFLTQFVYKDVFRDFILKWIVNFIAYGLRALVGIPAYKIGEWVMDNLIDKLDSLDILRMFADPGSSFSGFFTGNEGNPTDWLSLIGSILGGFSTVNEGPKSTSGFSELLEEVLETVFTTTKEGSGSD